MKHETVLVPDEGGVLKCGECIESEARKCGECHKWRVEGATTHYYWCEKYETDLDVGDGGILKCKECLDEQTKQYMFERPLMKQPQINDMIRIAELVIAEKWERMGIRVTNVKLKSLNISRVARDALIRQEYWDSVQGLDQGQCEAKKYEIAKMYKLKPKTIEGILYRK